MGLEMQNRNTSTGAASGNDVAPKLIWLRRGEQRAGPFSFSELQDMHTQGRLLGTDEICADGRSNWTPLSQVKAFSAAPKATGSWPPVPVTVRPRNTAQQGTQSPTFESAAPPASVPVEPASRPLPRLLDRLVRWLRHLGTRSATPPSIPASVPLPVETRNYYQPYLTESGTPAAALLALNGQARTALLERFQEHFNLEGRHLRNGGAMSPASILSLIGGAGGAMGLSHAASGTLFMATANPATLMTLGSGVGSAVMGAGGGIVAQAPFLPVAGAIMPVAAPLIAFQVLSTIVVMKQFEKVHERLNQIERNISRLLQRSEATFVGEIISATSRLESLEVQFAAANRFTPDMIVRLGLVEDKINPIFERYQFLYRAQGVERKASIEDLEFKRNDAYVAVNLSILDLRVDLLRLKLAIQEDPGIMRLAERQLRDKIEYYKTLWDDICRTPEQVAEIASDLRASVEEMNWIQRNIFKRGVRKEMQGQVSQLELHVDHLVKDNENVELAQQFSSSFASSLSGAPPNNILYWKDDLGEHCYYTSDIEIWSDSPERPTA